MRKLLFIITCICLLSGCTNAAVKDIKQDIKQDIQQNTGDIVE